MDVFLSYSHRDRDFVRQITSHCEEQGIEIWVDEKVLLAGDSIPFKIQEAIDRTQFFVVVLSQNSLKSRWVHKELEQAFDDEIAKGQTKVIPIILGQVEQLPGFLRSKYYADFSGWPHDKEQYDRSLKLLLRSIVAHKEEQVRQADRPETTKTKILPTERCAHRFLPDTLLNQLSLKYVDDWQLGKVFKGTFPVKRGYIDGANRVWKVSKQSVRALDQNSPELKIRDNTISRFLGEDFQGRPWCLSNRELFVLLDEKWAGIPLSHMADSTRVSLWRTPPVGVVGPVAPLKNGVSILSASDWRWNVIASPIGIPQASAGCGTSLLIANMYSWALTQSTELAWEVVMKFTTKMSPPISLFPQPSHNGFLMHCADHTLFWVKTDGASRTPLALGIKQGLPGTRADKVIMRREGEVWCAGSGGLAFTAPGAANQFMVLTDQTPQFLWADSASRVWGLFNQEIRCWVEQEDS